MLKQLCFNLGLLVGRYPRTFAFAGLLFLTFCSLGFTNLQITSDPQELWVPPSSRAALEQKHCCKRRIGATPASKVHCGSNCGRNQISAPTFPSYRKCGSKQECNGWHPPARGGRRASQWHQEQRFWRPNNARPSDLQPQLVRKQQGDGHQQQQNPRTQHPNFMSQSSSSSSSSRGGGSSSVSSGGSNSSSSCSLAASAAA